MIGIILAGGKGTRLHPLTLIQSKQLLPVYDKPMIYYPLSTLMDAGIKKFIIISSSEYIEQYKKLFQNGESLGIQINYLIQKSPDGIAQAFLISKKYIKNQNVCLILGDNVFYGDSINLKIENAITNLDKNISSIFAYYVSNPQDYGVITFKKNKPYKIIEKPKNPKSNYAVTGLYFYTKDVVDKASQLKFSKRGELEITSLNELYLKENRLNCEIFGDGCAWLDMGTHDGLLEASSLISTIEKRRGLKIGCIEEIAYKNGFIKRDKFIKKFKNVNSSYAYYLKSKL